MSQTRERKCGHRFVKGRGGNGGDGASSGGGSPLWEGLVDMVEGF